jgi:hypothetical protein
MRKNSALAACLILSAIGGFEAFQIACKGVSAPTNAQLEKGALDFCKARADYKLLAAAAAGALDPAPGSPRAVLEANEDIFCSSVAASQSDAGK